MTRFLAFREVIRNITKMEACGAVIGFSLIALALALAMDFGNVSQQLSAARAMQSLAMRTLER